MSKKTVAVIAVVVLFLVVMGVTAGTGGCILSFFFGPGVGEWLTGKSDFGSCALEWLSGAIPVFGLLAWVGSMMDNKNDVSQERINILFTTFDL